MSPHRSRPRSVRVFGDNHWRSVVRAVQTARNPAPLLARAAPLLAAAAEKQEHWATERLDAQMSALAATTARHIEQYLPDMPEVRIAFCGGVWASRERPVIIRSARPAGGTGSCRVIVTRSVSDPIEGAVRLAGSTSQ